MAPSEVQTVEELRPGTGGYNLHLKVLEAKVVLDRPKGPRGVPNKVAECIVGDQTGTIVFIARNEQIDVATPGSYITVKNAKIDMFRGSMRLAVDQWGQVLEGEVKGFQPKTDYNLSLIEFELVPVSPEQLQQLQQQPTQPPAAPPAALEPQAAEA